MASPPTVETDEGPQTASSWAVQFTREERDLPPTEPGRIRIDLLTDPWSVWCWGFEPIRRTIELRYPSVEVNALVGGMFEHVPTREERGFEIDPFFTMVQRTTGMPITSQAIHDHEPESTYPACIHVHAVRLLQPAKEAAYLRAMREAAYLDGLNISEAATAAQVAEQVGIEAEAFEEAMASGEPEREFRERIAWLQQAGLVAYPTLVVTAGERQTTVEGFQNIAGVVNLIESVSGSLHPARPPPELAAIVPEAERVATREVAEVLGTSYERAYDRLAEAEAAGELERERHPSGDTWRRPPA